jgi:hypothetical protein
MAFLASFLLTRTGRMIAGAGGVLLMVWAFGMHKEYQGAKKERDKIAGATNADVNRANNAGSKSRNGIGGVQLKFRD